MDHCRAIYDRRRLGESKSHNDESRQKVIVHPLPWLAVPQVAFAGLASGGTRSHL